MDVFAFPLVGFIVTGFPTRRLGRLLRFRLSEVDEWDKNSGGRASETRPSSKTTGSETEKNG